MCVAYQTAPVPLDDRFWPVADGAYLGASAGANVRFRPKADILTTARQARLYVGLLAGPGLHKL